jgi:hypothetical protein
MLSTLTQDSRPELLSVVPAGLVHAVNSHPGLRPGYSQWSLRDWVMRLTHTQDYVLATLSGPFGTVHAVDSYQDYVLIYSQSSLRTVHAVSSYPGIRPELLSVVPAGLARAINSPRRLAFFDRLIWTALAKNKSATRADRDPVPQGRLRIAQDVSPG